jgi:hypothetical protein
MVGLFEKTYLVTLLMSYAYNKEGRKAMDAWCDVIVSASGIEYRGFESPPLNHHRGI